MSEQVQDKQKVCFMNTEALKKEKMKEKEAEEKKKEDDQEYPYTVAVRFHGNSKSYTFGTELENIEIGDYVIVQTAQGVEIGKAHTQSVSTLDYPPTMKLAPVLRIATKKDQQQYRDNLELAKYALRICEEEVEKLGLGMHLLSAEYMLDRSKVLFIYQADARVDFRELLKKLGARLHCRIELRQIGERDKAKMVGGIGMCGMECCCSRFKTSMEVVSINMAKNQLLALNTEKLSGMCGKLMCCLRYENDNYKELTKGLPKMGAHVEYEGQMYRVTSMNVMTQEARLENYNGFETITIHDLKENAVVRKGVPLSRSKDGSHPNSKSLNERVKENAIAKGNYNQEELASNKDEKSKDQSKRNDRYSNGRNDNRNKQSNQKKRSTNNKKVNEKRGGNDKRRNENKKSTNHKRNDRRRNNSQQRNRPTEKKSNVTVRSFKSSKTKQKEKNGD